MQFDFFDADRNGVLTLDEFDELLQEIGIFVPEATTLAIFRRIDLNEDGFLDRSEFRVAFYTLGMSDDDEPGSGGFNPLGLLSPKDAFEVRTCPTWRT